MLLVYLAPVYFALFGDTVTRVLGIAAWALMALAFVPTLQFYRISHAWALALPAIALAYMIFTIDSAIAHWRGRGGLWKGRVSGKA